MKRLNNAYNFHLKLGGLVKLTTIYHKVHEANIITHKIEASIYNRVHPEIFQKKEQTRIFMTLKRAISLIDNNRKRALDFGAGTGNITAKLLRLGFCVTAVDISPEMCNRLKDTFPEYIRNGKLDIINSEIEAFEQNIEYDLIACYSVLHHLPEYLETIRKLAFALHKGGVMYLDHESIPYWLQIKNSLFLEPIDLPSFRVRLL